MKLTFNKKNEPPAFFQHFVKPLAKNKKESKQLNDELATVQEDDLSRVDRLISERKTVEARQTLELILQDDPLNIPLNILMHSLLLENKEYKILAIHTKKFLNLLVENKDYDMAAEVYYSCRVLDKKCKPINERHYFSLAQALCRKEHYCTAIELLKGFHKNYPNNKFIPKNYFLVGEIYYKYLKKEKKAKHIFSYIYNKYPDCPEKQKIKRLCRQMDSNK